MLLSCLFSVVPGLYAAPFGRSLAERRTSPQSRLSGPASTGSETASLRGSHTLHAGQSRQGPFEPPGRRLRALGDSPSTPSLTRFGVHVGVDRAGLDRNESNIECVSSICPERGERCRYTSGSIPLKCGSCCGPRRTTLIIRCRRLSSAQAILHR